MIESVLLALEFALYVLPNAKTLRFVESGSLLALQHKWTLRTCFNAQEEIYEASMEEVAQVRAVHPRLARFIGPPRGTVVTVERASRAVVAVERAARPG